MNRTWLTAVIAKLEQWRAFNPAIGWLLASGVLTVHATLAFVLSDPGWISAGGALIIILGALTIARPLIRQGDRKVLASGRTIARQGKEVERRVVLLNPVEDNQRFQDARAEYQHGPAIAIVGTLINGYGSLLLAPLGCRKRLLAGFRPWAAVIALARNPEVTGNAGGFILAVGGPGLANMIARAFVDDSVFNGADHAVDGRCCSGHRCLCDRNYPDRPSHLEFVGKTDLSARFPGIDLIVVRRAVGGDNIGSTTTHFAFEV